MKLILAIDLGTTLFKLALFDETGNACRIVRLPAPIDMPHPDWRQIDPTEFKRCLTRGIARLREEQPADFAQIQAVCFSTQANSFILLDNKHNPLCPIILWSDARARQFEPQVQSFAAATGFSPTTGIPQLSAEFALAKLLWIRQHNPRLWRTVSSVCFISDYLTLWFTGAMCVEAAVAGLSGGVDIRWLDWTDSFIDLLGLNGSMLPRIVRAGTNLGPVRPAIADELGLPRSCRFVVGCLDQYAGGIGTGSIRPGLITETTGTVLAVVRCTDHLTDAPSWPLFQGPGFAPDRFWQMIFSNTSANLLESYRQQLPDRPSIDELNKLAQSEPDGPVPLRIAPLGPGTAPSEALKQIRPEHTRGQVARAIMQCVASVLREQVQTLCDGKLPATICSAGGGARSDLWMRIKADTLGTTFCRSACDEPACLGAALLAGCTLGWGTLLELADRWVDAHEEFRPSAADFEAHTV